MCKVKVVIRREMLGAREQSWSCWTGKQGGIRELKASEIKREIRNGKRVYGLMIGEDGELQLDADGFFTRNVMEHRQSDNFRFMLQDDDCGVGSIALVCVGSHIVNGRVMYDCINNRFGLEELAQEDMRVYLRLGIVCSGAKLDGDEIMLAKMETDDETTETVDESEQPKGEIEVTEAVESIAVSEPIKEEKPRKADRKGKRS